MLPSISSVKDHRLLPEVSSLSRTTQAMFRERHP